MPKISFLIDGFNLYHSIKDAEKLAKVKLKWLDIPNLCASYLPNLRPRLFNNQTSVKLVISEIYYFSAYAQHLLSHDQDIVNRHQSFVKALEARNAKVVLGKFKKKSNVKCKACGSQIISHEEKETDVSIAIHLIKLAFEKLDDAICIVSGDTDILPAIKMAKSINPNLKIAVLFPFKRISEELKLVSDAHIKMDANQYKTFQFPDPIINIATSEIINKPSSW